MRRNRHATAEALATTERRGTLEWQVVMDRDLVVFVRTSTTNTHYCTAYIWVRRRESLSALPAPGLPEHETDDVRCSCVTIAAAPARWVDLCRDRKDRTIGIIPIDSRILAFTSKLADSQFGACPVRRTGVGKFSTGWA